MICMGRGMQKRVCVFVCVCKCEIYVATDEGENGGWDTCDIHVSYGGGRGGGVNLTLPRTLTHEETHMKKHTFTFGLAIGLILKLT